MNRSSLMAQPLILEKAETKPMRQLDTFPRPWTKNTKDSIIVLWKDFHSGKPNGPFCMAFSDRRYRVALFVQESAVSMIRHRSRTRDLFQED
jgi:hypothetical protein